jgi:hypothetical protein
MSDTYKKKIEELASFILDDEYTLTSARVQARGLLAIAYGLLAVADSINKKKAPVTKKESLGGS